MTREGEIDPLGRIGGQRYACAKQYRHEGNFNCIDQFRFGETPKKGTAPKQPDVFSGARFQCGQHLQLILGHDRTSGYSSGRRVREKTIVLIPGIVVRPAAAMGSKVLRPTTMVSN